MATPDTIWSRNSSDGKATFSVTRFNDINMLLASVHLVGYEVAHKHYNLEEDKGLINSVVNSQIVSSAISYAEGAMELYEELSKLGLMDHIDYGDELYEEEADDQEED